MTWRIYAHEDDDVRIPRGTCRGPAPVLPTPTPFQSSYLTTHTFSQAGICPICAHKNGWYVGQFSGHSGVVVPARHGWGSPIECWQIRSLHPDRDGWRWYSAPFPRGDTAVFVCDCPHPRTVALCEGPRDALALLHRFDGAIALMGTHVSPEVWGRIGDAVQWCDRIIFAFDSDAPGIFGARAALFALEGKLVEFLDPYPYKDFAAASVTR